MNYDKYLEIWLSGIEEEINFWENLLKTKGGAIGAQKEFQMRISIDTPFIFEREIEKFFSRSDISFLDVGSGPYSNCGFKTNFNLNMRLLDPLAEAYKLLKQKYAINSPINPEMGFAEMLSDKFEENTFDMVHMSNALDHTFDPIECIKQMIYVVKVGGIVILRHNRNEGEKGNYMGLHQWNIDIVDSNFIIWNPEHKIFCDKVIGEWATIVGVKETVKQGWKYIEVLLKKEREFHDKPSFIYKNILIEAMMGRLIREILHKE